ncbi:hydroxyacid oxidase 1-like isoform X2 [Dendronephthya gigantea]|uniref:hydroxyacid oxidase 1-like isoform X2 n=1 Tax=Dendronephthya gigantea TaxID=151771 RepID=UPI00106AD3A2|nr:hydroxyacid oxidase 1-like isoform X2 [Dendronephthya gigantea]
MANYKMNHEPVCVSDFEIFAKEHLQKDAFNYYASGANDMQTVGESTAAFKRSKRFQVWKNILRASSRIGTCMTLSNFSSIRLEEVASASTGLKWFQLSVLKNRKVMESLVRRAETSGYKAIVLTVDVPTFGKRYKDFRCNFTMPTPPNLKDEFSKSTNDGEFSLDKVNGFLDPSATWDTLIPWIKSVTSLPVVVKGILTAEDAKFAVTYGVNGIVVSSHGGRQLDCVPATIEVLPEIVRAVGNNIEVYLDGGVRFGSDVFKALALGARAVFIGRPIVWGLVYQGEEGVSKVLDIYKEELKETMMLSGCANLSDVVKEMVVHESFYRHN